LHQYLGRPLQRASRVQRRVIHIRFGNSLGFTINNAWLGGVDYFLHSEDYNKTLNLKLLYKEIVGKQHSAQVTACVGINMLNKKLSFTGFADFWLEDNTFGSETTRTVFHL
jgi:hypothetical protein